jgi:uncharacterized membrane protein YqaE (UPF0057 family)
MKTLKLLSFLLIGVIAFTSCKNNMSLTKRHYTKGYYFHKNKSVEQPEFNEGVASKHSKKTENASPIEIVQVKPTQITTAQTNNPIAEHNFTASASKKNSHTNTNKKINTTAVKSLNQTKKELQQNSKQTKKLAAKGDANLVLMVILAIFPVLCLIAVYLHDGGITKNFWIDLILHITFIGMIIYALLVVLDVVDFA